MSNNWGGQFIRCTDVVTANSFCILTSHKLGVIVTNNQII